MAVACRQSRFKPNSPKVTLTRKRMEVPFLDLSAHHCPIQRQLMEAIQEVVESSAFSGGPFVERFENAFAQYCQTDHAIGVGSGTESLWLALKAQGIGSGDEVITAPNTFFATAEAISHTGATPVFVDVSEETLNIDVSLIEAAITERSKAIIPVHLFGQPADIDPILTIAKRHGLFVLEDAAQAAGAEYRGRRSGALGNCASFSFYPGKNLGALGEAGALTTNDADLARRLRVLRDHGQAKKHQHSDIGWNARMDGIQAAVLRVKLQRLDEANEKRRAHAALYSGLLRECPLVKTPSESAGNRHIFHIYAVRVPNRDQTIETLAQEGIRCSIHYPVPIHQQPAYQHLGYAAGSFPCAERSSSQLLSLPMYPELTQDQITHVAETLKATVENQAKWDD